ncbi:hypothetical protein BKA69DRAFT_646450 [Paraphysoderma sedebokerense]|nr:hypothetical protein BKA69DRAFT_646450 [Paraphysoderma sedebokerense]
MLRNTQPSRFHRRQPVANSQVSNDIMSDKSISKLIQQARTSGKLNLSAKLESVKALPEIVWNIYNLESSQVDFSFERSSNSWYEVVDLTKFIAADNSLGELDERISQYQALNVLDLHNNQISQLPASVGSLSNLTVLNLAFNKLSQLPDTIFSLPISELYLQQNEFSSSLPSGFSKLTKLKVLDLSVNSITSLPNDMFYGMSNITKLNLSKNKLMILPGIRPNSNDLARLFDLEIQDNKLQESIFNSTVVLPSLNRLDIRQNSLKCINFDIHALELKELYCSFNALSSITSILVHSPKLSSLDMRNNILSSLPKEVLQLSSLKRLDISNNNIRFLPPELGFLPDLNSILFEGNMIKGFPKVGSTNQILKILRDRAPIRDSAEQQENISMSARSGDETLATRAESLTILDIRRNGLLDLSNRNLIAFDSTVVSPSSNTSSVKTLHLHTNNLTAFPEYLSEVGLSLMSLTLHRNKISNLISPDSVILQTTFQHLQDLDLSHNTMQSFPDFPSTSFPSLNSLNLSFNKLNTFPSRIASHFPKLQVLMLSNNLLAEIKVEGLENLTHLDVSNNSIGRLPPELGKLNGLKVLKVEGNCFRIPRWDVVSKGSEAVLQWCRSRLA